MSFLARIGSVPDGRSDDVSSTSLWAGFSGGFRVNMRVVVRV